MMHQRATLAVIRNLHNDDPDYYLHEVWERLSLTNLEIFKEEAWRWLRDKSELRTWSFTNADWKEVYAHFVSEAGRQIDEHNGRPGSIEREENEDPETFLRRVIDTAPLPTPEMAERLRGMLTRTGEERQVVTTEDKWAEYDACNTCGSGPGLQCLSLRNGKPAKNAHSGRPKVGATPTPEPAATTPAERHEPTITPGVLAGLNTFRATCSCGGLNGANITSRYLAEQEFARHRESTLVPA